MNPVGIFWDYENCAPPAGTPGYIVAERLRAACGAHGSIIQFRAYLELSASHPTPSVSSPTSAANPESSLFLSTSPKTVALRSELQSSGVSLIDCPHDSRKNVADAMLACDLVCFALDHPNVPPTPQSTVIPSSPFSIPSTPFSYVSTPTTTPSKTTVVLVSGDRDFAYPLAVLKARRYEVGLIIPPGGAHPALRAQASWVLNWKDVMEDTSANPGLRGELSSTAGTKTAPSIAQATTSGAPGSSIEPKPSPRRSSFARRGSTSGSRRGSVSSSSNLPPLPPPPPAAESSSSRAPSSSPVPSLQASTSVSPIPRPPLPPVPPDDPSPQLPPTPKMSRRSSLRRASKAGSRPPSRSRSRVGARNAKADTRPEQGGPGPSRIEQKRPQPTIIPVPLTSSPVGSAGPSFAAMSPQGQRPHTPPLFSTHPVSPPPPAAPPALAPPPTPPVRAPVPSAKPPTPPRDPLRTPHRSSVPHVSTPHPPLSTPQEQVTASKSANEDSSRDTSARPPVTSTLQSLVPAAPALRPTNVRPVLTVPSYPTPVANSSALTPATPVTPPASPPFRPWARLQPVNDETDADGDPAAVANGAKKGKERSRDGLDVANRESSESQRYMETEQSKSSDISDEKGESMRLVVDVAMAIKSSGLPSATSGVDSILKSYSERTPGAEYDNEINDFEQAEMVFMPSSRPRAPAPDVGDEDEEEEKFDESFFASLARSPPANVPRTPGTIKALLFDLVGGESAGSVCDANRPSHSGTPRPIQRTHSLPAGVPIIQTLLAGLEGTRTESKRNSLDAHIELLESVAGQSDDSLGRVYSRTSSPAAPPLIHRNSLPLTGGASISVSALGLSSNPVDDSTYWEFKALIDVLERLRREGNERPLRSLIGNEFSREIFANAGASSFREYVSRANGAGVVEVGGGSVQGREWISLSGRWQGIIPSFK